MGCNAIIHNFTKSNLLFPRKSFCKSLTYSVADANDMLMKDGLSVSVYISIPVPRK